MNSVAFSLAAFAPLSQMSFCLTNCVKVGVKVGHFIGFRINGGKTKQRTKTKKHTLSYKAEAGNFCFDEKRASLF